MKSVEFVAQSRGDRSVGIFESEARVIIEMPTMLANGKEVLDDQMLEFVRDRLTKAFVDIFDDVETSVYTSDELDAWIDRGPQDDT